MRKSATDWTADIRKLATVLRRQDPRLSEAGAFMKACAVLGSEVTKAARAAESRAHIGHRWF